MKIIKMLPLFLVSFLSLSLCIAQKLPYVSAYTCAFTEKQWEVFNSSKIAQRDKEFHYQLQKIDSAYGGNYVKQYHEKRTYQEKQDLVVKWLNYDFNVSNIFAPECKPILDLFKMFNLTLVSGKDKERCLPVFQKLREHYGDSLLFYYTPVQRTGCNVDIYEVKQWEKIDEICCLLRDISNTYAVGNIYITFYEREVFEPAPPIMIESDSITEEDRFTSAAIVGRGNETIIERLIIVPN